MSKFCNLYFDYKKKRILFTEVFAVYPIQGDIIEIPERKGCYPKILVRVKGRVIQVPLETHDPRFTGERLITLYCEVCDLNFGDDSNGN